MKEDLKITDACDNINFCTCVDRECECNPCNCTLGCTACVYKCLQERQIPVCFFRAQEPDMERKQDYSFMGFANFTKRHAEGK
ncbi:MAG: hypothetical protein HUJ86_04670 [Synergistes sp.]|nr:hypothetical protein [Synergistes sp.]